MTKPAEWPQLRIALAGIVMVMALACSSVPATPTPEPTATADSVLRDTAFPTPVPNTPTPEPPPPPPEPTATPEPATATPSTTPEPTATALLEPTPTATPEPTPEPTTKSPVPPQIPFPTATPTTEPAATPTTIPTATPTPDPTSTVSQSTKSPVPPQIPFPTAAPTPAPTPHPMASRLVGYHPKLQEAVLSPPPPTAGAKAFLADDKLSGPEMLALDRAQSVFGLPEFYRAWELETLKPNEIQAVLYMLTFYDPYTVVHDITADPDDPNAEGADLTRALDLFDVYPGSCVYCKGQRYYQSGDYFSRDTAFNAAIGASQNNPAVFQRTKLLHLAHHATVQADELSPCDLRNLSEEELLALGVIRIQSHRWSPSYGAAAHSFMPSVRLTQSLLDAGMIAPRGGVAAEVLIKPGEVLSPFTHAMRAIGAPPDGRGMEECLEAVKAVVDWDRKRYSHFLYSPEETMSPWFEKIFPQNPAAYPVWASFLVNQSGGQDKGMRLMDQFRALNLPALRDQFDISVHEDLTEFLRQYGPISSSQPNPLSTGPRHGVFLPALGLHLHRNIGFGMLGYEGDLGELFHTIPDGCRLNRTGAPFQYRHGYALEYICPEAKSAFVKLDPGPGPHAFADISSGYWHTCALEEDGRLVCWGSMKNGESLRTDGKFKALSGGWAHVCALHEDGTPECWGDDSAGQASPPAGEKFVSISTGLYHTCALREDGSPVCWGRSPRVPPSENLVSISSGWQHACGLRVDGTAKCWGFLYDRRLPPSKFDSISSSGGRSVACGLRSDGRAICWGRDEPTHAPPADEELMVIDNGHRHACGLRRDGTAVCWGETYWGQGPRPNDGPYMTISSGWRHNCALRLDGSAECWGTDNKGQASPPPPTAEAPFSDRDALVALYNATDGPNWANAGNWLTTEPISRWYGVGVDRSERVRELNLDSNELTGTIPGALGGLTSLVELDLGRNRLTGTIPASLGFLTDLEELRLGENRLSGNVPANLGNITNLQRLLLNDNQLTGTIPPKLGDLANLTEVHLSNNEVTGCIPAGLQDVPTNDFSELGLLFCETTPEPVSSDFATDRAALVALYNAADGANWENNYKWLSEAPIGEWKGVTADAAGRVTRLHLGGNLLSGKMPPELGDLTSLTGMWLSANRLSGPIPPELGDLTSLTHLYLSSNRLSGQIPPELGNLTSLARMSLSPNQLTGSIPAELGSLANLEGLWLSGNQFTGCIPAALRDLPNSDLSSLGLPFC